MVEKEIKILEVDVPRVQYALQKLGATLYHMGDIVDTYYNLPPEANATLRDTVKVRRKHTEQYITYKKKKPSTKIKKCLEIEVQVPTHYDIHASLTTAGLVPTWIKTKYRYGYMLPDGTHVDIDLYPGLPPLVEIEGASAKVITQRQKKLDLHEHTRVTWGSRKLMKHYQQPLTPAAPLYSL